MIYVVSQKKKEWKYLPVKIGYSKEPEKRLSQLQTGSPYRLCIRKTMDGSMHEEKQIHDLLMDFNISGEWFLFGGERDNTNILDAILKSSTPASAILKIQGDLASRSAEEEAFSEWVKDSRTSIKQRQSEQGYQPKTTTNSFVLSQVDRDHIRLIYDRIRQ